MARAHTQQALDVLVAALSDETASVRVNAANSLLDRGWGRAIPALPTSASPGQPYLEVRFVWPGEPPMVEAHPNGNGSFALAFDPPEDAQQ